MGSRVRSLGELTNAQYVVKDFNPDGSTFTYPTVTSTSKSQGSLQTTTDVVIPGYAKRKAKGEVFMNPFSTSKTQRSTASGVITIGPDPNWGTRTFTGDMPCVWSIPPNRPAWFNQRILDAQARTLLSAHAKVASEEFLSLVTVAEAKKTASMIARPLSGATDLINRIVARKSKLLAKGLNLAGAAFNAWNEYRFGWKPLLYELEQIRDAYYLSEVYNSKPVRLVARSSDKDIKWDPPLVITQGTVQYLSGVVMSGNFTHTARVSSGVLYELHDETQASATARLMGLRLSDVPSTIWELVPYSFVVDRFLDVGKWLSAIMPKPGVTVLGTWTTTVEEQSNHHHVVEAFVNLTDPVVKRLSAKGGTYFEEIQTVSRVANPAIPLLPTVNYRDLNLVQQIDHVALIGQRLVNVFRK